MIAAGRALATNNRLIDDPFAEPLVRAVGLEFFIKMIDGDIDLSEIENASPARMQAIIDGVAVRTKYFDDRLIEAMNAGVRQAVILAAGSMHAPTGWPGRRTRWSSRSTSRKWSTSRRPRWPVSAPSRGGAAHGWHRPAVRLARCVTGGRPGSHGAHRMACRRPADLLAA
ncbi:leucine carboxyl methyltransferase family protein [Mycobacterium xenopi 3993]|nr:leucine carboxyl methyltransferase family protein [Mycobacterium xenopi 3993]